MASLKPEPNLFGFGWFLHIGFDFFFDYVFYGLIDLVRLVDFRFTITPIIKLGFIYAEEMKIKLGASHNSGPQVPSLSEVAGSGGLNKYIYNFLDMNKYFCDMVCPFSAFIFTF